MNRIAVERKLPLKRPTARGGNFASEILSALRIQASKVRVVFASLRSVQNQGPLDLVHRSTPVGASLGLDQERVSLDLEEIVYTPRPKPN